MLPKPDPNDSRLTHLLERYVAIGVQAGAQERMPLGVANVGSRIDFHSVADAVGIGVGRLQGGGEPHVKHGEPVGAVGPETRDERGRLGAQRPAQRDEAQGREEEHGNLDPVIQLS